VALGVVVAVAVEVVVDVAVEVVVDVEVPVAVAVGEPVFVPVVVVVAVEVEVEVAVADVVPVAVAVDVGVDVAELVDVDVGLESMTTVCVSVASGNTIQLVPSEMANRPPPIFSLVVPNPILSAVRLLNTTNPSSSPDTNMVQSETLINSTQSPVLVLPAAGSVNVIGSVVLPRVVNTDP
jgi:hypothetical protein